MQFLMWLFYESLPYFYAAMAGIAFNHPSESRIAIAAGVALLVCSYNVLSMRYEYRISSQLRNMARKSF